MGTGRNEPCPCGSGRKYKQCCLRERQAQRAAPADRGVGVAIAWIRKEFRRQVPGAIETGFFAGIDPQIVADALAALGDERVQDVNAKIGDFVLSEAIFERAEGAGRGIDWVLERAPRLSDEQRDFLARLADAPLRLYEVVESRPGEGLQLRDALADSRSPPFVTEPLASTTLGAGDMLGARVLRWPERVELSGVVYTLDRGTAEAVMQRVQRQLDGDLDPAFRALLDPELARDGVPVASQLEDLEVAAAIRGAWLLDLIVPRVPPSVDASAPD